MEAPVKLLRVRTMRNLLAMEVHQQWLATDPEMIVMWRMSGKKLKAHRTRCVISVAYCLQRLSSDVLDAHSCIEPFSCTNQVCLNRQNAQIIHTPGAALVIRPLK